MVFSIILGTVVTLLVKSQTIFRAEQGVSEMDQNARLLMDFLTRDIQQSRRTVLASVRNSGRSIPTMALKARPMN